MKMDTLKRINCLRQRRHIDHEAVLDVALEHPCVRLVDRLNRDQFDVRDDVLLGAEVEHFLRLPDSTDERASNLPAPENEVGDARRRMQTVGNASEAESAIARQQIEVGVEV